MKQKVEALEARLEWAERRALLGGEVIKYLSTLAQMPEDAALLYTVHGMKVSHEIGKSARILLEKLSESTHHNG